MATQVVIDHDILGWGDEHEEQLLVDYRHVLQVGKHPNLPHRGFDVTIAEYCQQNDCDLITGDARAYTHFFEAGIKRVKITRKDVWKADEKYIYLVQIDA
jgi:hypothetical protein